MSRIASLHLGIFQVLNSIGRMPSCIPCLPHKLPWGELFGSCRRATMLAASASDLALNRLDAASSHLDDTSHVWLEPDENRQPIEQVTSAINCNGS